MRRWGTGQCLERLLSTLGSRTTRLQEVRQDVEDLLGENKCCDEQTQREQPGCLRRKRVPELAQRFAIALVVVIRCSRS